VFVLSARGYSQQRIQQELFLAPGTVNAHAMSIYHKLGVHSQQELIALAERECEELERGTK
jgi:DNA-binding CsgD family transcriptional regulator